MIALTGKRSLNEKQAGYHDFGFILKKNLWVFILILAAFLLLVPFSTAGLTGSSIFDLAVTHEQMKFRLFHESAVPAIIAALCLSGVLCGMTLFGFLLRKREATIFLSLGITRQRLFFNRFLAGLLYLLAGTAIPMAVSMILNIAALGNYDGLVRNTVFLTAGMFLCGLFSMLVTACAVFAAGTAAEALVFWAGLMALPHLLFFSVNTLLKKLFWGNAWGAVFYSGGSSVRPSVAEQLSAIDPVMFMEKPLRENGVFIRPLSSSVPEPVDTVLVIGWAIACLCLCIVALALIKRRKAENCGTGGKNKVLSEVVIFICELCIFAFAFSFLSSFGILIAVCLAGLLFAVVHLFFRKALFREGRAKHFALSFVIQAVIVAALCLFCAAVMPANAKSILKNRQMVSAEITYAGDPALLFTKAVGSSTGKGYYLSGSIPVSSEEAIEAVRQIQQDFIDRGRQTPGAGEEVQDTVVPFDVCFTYTDAEGKQYVWYYDCAQYRQLELMTVMEDTAEVKKAQTACFDPDVALDSRAWQAYRSAEIYLSDPYYCDTYSLSVDDAARKELLDALASDTQSLSAKDRYFPSGKARAVLMFTNTAEQDLKYFSYHLDNAYVYITDAYENTLNWLKENDLLELIGNQPEAEYIILQQFDPYMGINGLKYPMGMYFMSYCADSEDAFTIQKDFGNPYTITDEEETAALMKVLKNGYYMTEGGYLAAVKLEGIERLRYMFLPQHDVPDFLIR